MPSLASPAFPDDDGEVQPALAAALSAYAEREELAPVLGALTTARVFVPVVALLGDTPADGDKNAEMAAVLMTGADGRTALLAFSSVASMQQWDPAARPVPVTGPDAARAAIDEQATAILLDIAGPTFTAIETADVEHLARGHTLASTDAGYVWVNT